MLFETLAGGEEDKGGAEAVNEEMMRQWDKREPRKRRGGKKKERLSVKGSRPQDVYGHVQPRRIKSVV